MENDMKNMTIWNIARACKGHLAVPAGKHTGTCSAAGMAVIRGYSVKEAAGIVIDSRKVEPGDIFVAIRGERVDGHQFIREVFDKGAIAVVCEEEPEELPGPCIRVEDSLAALRQIAAFYREQMPIPIVGITGSVGKTSTKEFVASVLAQKYKTHKTQGNFNNEIGVPLTLLAMPEDVEAAVVEMGINHFGEMHRLSEMVKPDICVMTNIGQCHLEFLGSRDGILKAKSEIFDFMNPEGTVCVNGDDDKLMTIEEVHGKKPVHFGLSPENDIYADTIVSRGLLGSTATIHTPDSAAGCAYGVKCPGGDCSWFTARTDDRADRSRNRCRAGSKRQKPCCAGGGSGADRRLLQCKPGFDQGCAGSVKSGRRTQSCGAR